MNDGTVLAIVALVGTIAQGILQYLDKKNSRENETKLKLQEQRQHEQEKKIVELERKTEECEEKHRAAAVTTLMNRRRIEEVKEDVHEGRESNRERVEEVRGIAVEALRVAEDVKSDSGKNPSSGDVKGV